MSVLLPLPVAIPLLAAALVAALDHVTPQRVEDAIAICAAGAATAISLVIMVESEHGLVLHWFGGWHPVNGVAIGIAFAADPLGAGMAALATGLAFLALIFSWTYMREASRLFNVLMLVFCGAMAGFSLTGDLFNMFVWFELMGVAAYALAGFKISELGPIQGAINFAVSNTVGAYMMLIGIGLLYARTGALNLAQIGHTLAPGRTDGLLIAALTLIFVGFMIKGAIVPFHFWLADAHAVAPAPVCVLYSGAMVELGLLAIARLYWTIFDSPFGLHHGEIKAALVAVGLLTAIVGAVMAFLQRHLKRMLAYSTISHAGGMLVGIGLLDSKALAGTANLVLSHGLLKGGLFLVAGIVLVKLRAVDELRLHGAGRGRPLLAALWFGGTIGLVGFPYVGTFLGHSLVDDGGSIVGIHWSQPLLMLAAGISTAALLRAGARVFLGWGPSEDPLLAPQPPEDPPEKDADFRIMAAVATVAIALGLVASVAPGLQQRTEAGAERFRNHVAYAQDVLHGKPEHVRPQLPFSVEPATAESWGYGIGGLVLALVGAGAGLWWQRLPEASHRLAVAILGPPAAVLKGAHSGIVGEYLLWIVAGTSILGGVFAVLLR